MAIQGAFSLGNFLVGFALGYSTLLVMRPLIGKAGYDARLWYQITLIVVFFVELIQSSLRVAAEAFTPGYSMNAGIIKVPLDVKSDLAITLFSNLISLTPGTLTLDVGADKECLYVHFMYIDDEPEVEARELKNTLEAPVIRALGKDVASASQMPAE